MNGILIIIGNRILHWSLDVVELLRRPLHYGWLCNKISFKCENKTCRYRFLLFACILKYSNISIVSILYILEFFNLHYLVKEKILGKLRNSEYASIFSYWENKLMSIYFWKYTTALFETTKWWFMMPTGNTPWSLANHKTCWSKWTLHKTTTREREAATDSQAVTRSVPVHKSL